ncbi:MAG: phosphoribosylanthranilate isomerase [Kiritimatiellae bacterium]|nr:phosphoribosylanthranilate isomerase [Kiritimatiellia bacterium]
MKPEIKICGIKTLAVAKAAAKGAGYAGFIFEQSSPRAVSPAKAAKIREALPPGVKTVGVFVSAGTLGILAAMREARLDIVQLHRSSSDEEIRMLKDAGYGVWILDDGAMPGSGAADGVLVDAKDGGKTGGTGKRSDWSRARELASRGVFTILAGGLSADNLDEAAKTGASVLDVNSSLETSPGRKSAALVRNLLRSREA